MNITDRKRFAQEAAAEQQYHYDMARNVGMSNTAAGVSMMTSAAQQQNQMAAIAPQYPYQNTYQNDWQENLPKTKNLLGNFTVKKAYNGFTIETRDGDIILCPEIKDVGEQIVAYLIANKLEA